MKLSLVTIAALMACNVAQALTPAEIVNLRGNGLKEIYLSGSSSQRLFIAAWFQQQCRANTFDVFFNGTGTAPSGTSYRAYSCDLGKPVGNYLSGTPVLLIKRDTGDSFQGVNPIALEQAQTNMLVDSSCSATATPSPATDIQVPSFACPNTQNVVSDAGLSDVEPALMQRPVNLPDGQTKLNNSQLGKLDTKTVNQTIFGLAVNKELYRALREDQGRIPIGGVIEEDPEKRHNAKKSGSIGTNQGTIQAVGTKAVQLGSAAGNVENCLGTTVEGATGFAYGLGVIGRENSPIPGGQPDKGYRFVRIGNDPIVRDFAKLGQCDFVYNATMQWNSDTSANGPDKEAFLNSPRNNAGKPTSLNGADPDTQQGVMSPPSTYSGPYDDLTDPVALKFSSRVDRLNNNSGTALRIVK
jgi:hypothetical protein